MFRHNKILAIFLLTVYGIVFGHSIVPHHHHNENVCTDELIIHNEIHQYEGHLQTSLCCPNHDEIEFHNHHQSDDHYACDFEVTPLVYDGLSIAVLYLPNVIKEIRIPQVTIKNKLPQFIPQKLPEGYDFAVPLRAPPYFS